MTTSLSCEVCGTEVCRLVNADPAVAKVWAIPVRCMACVRASGGDQ